MLHNIYLKTFHSPVKLSFCEENHTMIDGVDNLKMTTEIEQAVSDVFYRQ